MENGNSLVKVLQEFANNDKASIEQLIAQTILKNIKNFENINLTNLAKKAFTSTASVIRFCKKLGYNGYSEFKILLIQSLQDNFKKDLQNCMINDYFSCNKFWIEMRQYNKTSLEKENMLKLQNYFIEQKKVYLKIDGCPQTSINTFVNKLNMIFTKLEFFVASSTSFNTIKEEKSLIVFISKKMPHWFEKQDILYLHFFNPLFTSLDISWSDKFDYMLILLIKLFASI